MGLGIVPRLQAAVVASPLGQNERVRFLLSHPAGPFTSAWARPAAAGGLARPPVPPPPPPP